ncbi:GMC oxidoreductase-domain-containing protein [Talaromyces proteolyticus]|uniref:glucose oxidase n=1 Tax=Talaromyces proteolyticus TaxID=1131652 RepID=A0AAD4KJ45_9EURO|nr:GMC oxidoreductase-domain-containing protein [Talaromyces proteolyticus]KAH8692705.1 GMC oxidoreductase-domain-containing protein [Talaromyces proteolyticus]
MAQPATSLADFLQDSSTFDYVIVSSRTAGLVLAARLTKIQQFDRPSAEDIGNWEQLGNKGWSWADLAPYYFKSEMLDGDGRKRAPGKRTSTAKSLSSMAILHSTRLSRVLRPKDPWSGNHLGFYGTLSTITRDGDRAIRSYAATGYLMPNIHRKNLKILTDATVTRVIMDQSTDTARGVEFWFDGVSHQVFATAEVILSASSVHSPRLLELSEIGDPKVLCAGGIECVVQLPDAGNNLQEHPITAVTHDRD